MQYKVEIIKSSEAGFEWADNITATGKGFHLILLSESLQQTRCLNKTSI